jgi:HK97 family phage prohead protease
MNKSRMRLEIKEISTEGTFEGLLSPYGNIDKGGDIVERGAYVKTLKDQGVKRPLLWQHKPDVPIGELILEDRADGLWAKGRLLMESAAAQEAYLFMKAGIVSGLSIGFEAIRAPFENGIRKLKEIRLYEGSIVTFPMNEQALITSVKSNTGAKSDFNQQLSHSQILDADFQMYQALRKAHQAVIGSDLTREEKLSAAHSINEQFVDAHSTWLPRFMDVLAQRPEQKAGRMFSGANRDKMKAISDMILALIAEDAGASDDATTSEGKAAIKPEPEPIHSAIVTRIDELRALIPA